MKKQLFSLLLIFTSLLVFQSCKKKDLENPIAGITMSKTSVTLKPQETEKLSVTFFPDNATNKGIVWKSSNEAVATVDNEGKIMAIKEGAAIITATSATNPGISAKCDVTVAWAQMDKVSGNVSGVWEKNTTVFVSGHITVPEGKTLTIEEGVKVIFDDNGVGASHTKIEMIVNGSLYCKGTKSNPIMFTVAESKRTSANTFAGLWGGIVATAKCPEMLFDNVIIEYTGGEVVSDSPSAVAGIYTAGGDAAPQITTSNVNGKYVVMSSILRNGASDAVYFMGGSVIMQNNILYANGKTGGEGINVKAGCKVDASQNIIYSPNTNGFKLSSSGQDDAAGRFQASIKAYNNTIINAGWRRDGVKGGSIYVEKAALVGVFNNLIVNSKFKAMTPKWGTVSVKDGCDDKSIIDYNFYASGSQTSTLAQDVSGGTTTAYLGYTLANTNVYPAYVDQHSVVSASAGDTAKDPKFVNFPFNSNVLTSYTYDSNWDFSVQAGSPVLTGAYSGTGNAILTPHFVATGITVNGMVYKSQAPVARFGAFGTK
ncbi:Ig-like domain-containing protein [Pedobacter sp.]|uniref:Ig-like domain-containing protein n=1 Tax=Pedobacter sp. TaxID=1411316 RepID=UPI00396CEDF9